MSRVATKRAAQVSLEMQSILFLLSSNFSRSDAVAPFPLPAECSAANVARLLWKCLFHIPLFALWQLLTAEQTFRQSSRFHECKRFGPRVVESSVLVRYFSLFPSAIRGSSHSRRFVYSHLPGSSAERNRCCKSLVTEMLKCNLYSTHSSTIGKCSECLSSYRNHIETKTTVFPSSIFFHFQTVLKSSREPPGSAKESRVADPRPSCTVKGLSWDTASGSLIRAVCLSTACHPKGPSTFSLTSEPLNLIS